LFAVDYKRSDAVKLELILLRNEQKATKEEYQLQLISFYRWCILLAFYTFSTFLCINVVCGSALTWTTVWWEKNCCKTCQIRRYFYSSKYHANV